MIRNILVPVAGDGSDAAAFAAANAAARLDGAHLQFLHVRLDVVAVLSAMSADASVGATMLQSTVDDLETDAQAGVARAQAAVAAFCAANAIPLDQGNAKPGEISASFTAETGDAADIVAVAGRFADLIVSQRLPTQEMETGVLQTALVASGRPVLIATGATPTLAGGTVVIAWKDRPEAARAVAYAMPLLERAARVVILSVEEEGAAPESSCEFLRAALQWHNAATEIIRLPRGDAPPVQTLLAKATELGAGLLVMGGYSHSRLRETIFGGFTRSVLGGVTLPVLMAH